MSICYLKEVRQVMKIGNYYNGSKMGFTEHYLPVKSTQKLAEEIRIRSIELENSPSTPPIGSHYIDLFI